MDPALDVDLWRALAHAVIPIVVALATPPGKDANGLRLRLATVAAFIIGLANQVGVDLAALGSVDGSQLAGDSAIGFAIQEIAYKVTDKGVLPDGRKLNDYCLGHHGDIDY